VCRAYTPAHPSLRIEREKVPERRPQIVGNKSKFEPRSRGVSTWSPVSKMAKVPVQFTGDQFDGFMDQSRWVLNL
jgi:hypothetical protein